MPAMTQANIDKARAWRQAHRARTDRLIAHARTDGYAPALTYDMPEVWAPEHWKWFAETHEPTKE